MNQKLGNLFLRCVEFYSTTLYTCIFQEFNLSLLDECMHYGANLFLNQEKDGSVQESPLSPLPHTVGGLALFTAAKFALFQNIEHLLALIPSPSFIYNPSGFSFTTRETKYALQIQDLFNDSSFLEILQQMVPIVAQYLQLFQKHGAFMDLSIEAMVHLCRFTVLILEVRENITWNFICSLHSIIHQNFKILESCN